MVDPTNPPTNQEIQIIGAATAPVIFADGVAAVGVLSGVAEIELATRALTPLADGSTRSDMLIVGHLRVSASGLAGLKDAIQKIEMMLAPTDAKPN